MHKIFNVLQEGSREHLREKDQPRWTEPMLATLTGESFSREDWIFERKLDGERCLAFKKGSVVRLMSRNKKNMNQQYPEIREAIQQQEHDFIVDGEIVAFEGDVTSFAKLQPRMHTGDPDLDVKA